jgi:hypothetical protein
LATAAKNGAWPAVLLHRDAVLVQAPADILQMPPGDLIVDLGSAGPAPIAEIRTLAQPAAGDRRTAMIRLARGLADATTVRLDRPAVLAGLASGATLWDVVRRMGILPDEWPPPPTRSRSAPAEVSPVAVKTVAGETADWCTIFWWLC